MRYLPPVLLLSILCLSACHSRKGDPAPRAGGIVSREEGHGGWVKIRRRFGPVTVVEDHGPLFISDVTIVVRTPKDKALVEGILKAAFPKNMGVSDEPLLEGLRPIGPEYPGIKTVDEYVGGIVESSERYRREKPERPGSPVDAKKLRRKVLKDLGRSKILVYRYVEVPAGVPDGD